MFMKRIGIIGGSYNPPHLGHLEVAEASRAKLGFDEVWLWVSFNIFKDPASYAPLADRVEMTRLLAGDRPWLKVVDIEKDFGDTMTATSMTMLQTLYPEDRFTWIFGDDNFASFHTWDREKFNFDNQVVPDWQYILNRFSVAVIEREGYREAALTGQAAQYAQHLRVEDATQLGHRNGWSSIDHKTPPLSSTLIKGKLLAGERNIEGLLPEVENYIYDHGLLNTSADFNNMATKPSAPKNDVRYHAFLQLASTANLLKTVGLHNNVFNAEELLDHASASWDKSFRKGDLAKYEDVPGELADCLISLYWIADLQHILLAKNQGEDQGSVCDWCDLHYPDRGMAQRLKDYMEELTELCVCEGLEKSRFMNLLSLVLHDPQADDLYEAFDKNLALLHEYAQDAGGDLQQMLDEKMGVNRQKTTEQSAARQAAKELAMRPEMK